MLRWKAPTKGICESCHWKEQKATQIAVRVLLVTGRVAHGSSRIFELLENRVSGPLQKPVEILRVECGQGYFCARGLPGET